MIQFREDAYLPHDERERARVVPNRRERDALDRVRPTLELVQRVVNRPERSGREEGRLVEFALISRQRQGVVLDGPGRSGRGGGRVGRDDLRGGIVEGLLRSGGGGGGGAVHPSRRGPFVNVRGGDPRRRSRRRTAAGGGRQ